MQHNDLPALRDTIEAYGLNAKKSLGQHFLLDLNITRKITRLIKIASTDIVIEIGPGPGGLTRAVLETGAKVVAIERDARCIEALSELVTAYPGRLHLIQGDALKVSEQEILQKLYITKPVKLVSNLPYNISTELLIKWLKVSPRWWTEMALMFQKEVGDRIIAAEGNKSYGRLTVISQAITEAKRGFDLPARAFTPPPKVDSSVLHFQPKSSLGFEVGKLERVTAAAFSQRRKMLRASLKPLFGPDTQTILLEAGLAPTLRAEQIKVSDFITLANKL